jgi:AcrR family transcriptional regulator
MDIDADEPRADQSQDGEAQRRSIGARRNPETAEAVLAAAEAIIIEEGPSKLSFEAVARRARAGKPTIYRWWPNKVSLLLDVYHRQKPATIHMDTGSVEGDVRQFFDHLLGHWAKTCAAQVFRYIIAEAQHDETAAEALRAYAAERRVQSGRIFERGIERGELRGDVDVGLASDMLSSMAWQRLLLGRLDPGAAEIAQMARQMVRGLAAPGAD